MTMRPSDPLIRAWLALVALSALATGVSLLRPDAPAWAATASDWLPFRYTFGYPIEVLAGDLTTSELWRGLAAQAAWIGIGVGLVAVVWRFGVRRYSAVGN